MADRIQDLGVFTAYGEAREAGYEGSKAEFELGLKRSAEYAENAQASADAAAASADDAELSAAGAAESAEDAETSAGEATQSATDAAASAVAAAGSANAASASATQAASNAQAALGDIAPVFDTTKAYNVGDYVIYTDGKLYRFTVAHAARAWTGTDTVEIKLTEEVSKADAILNDLTATKTQIQLGPTGKACIALNMAIGEPVSLTPYQAGSAIWRYAIVSCSPGQRVQMDLSGGSTPRAYGFIDSNNILLAVAAYGEFSGTVIAPTNTAKLIVQDNSGTGTAFFVTEPGRVDTLETTVTEQGEEIDLLGSGLSLISDDTQCNSFFKELYLEGADLNTTYKWYIASRNDTTYKYNVGIAIDGTTTIVAYLHDVADEPSNPVVLPEYHSSGITGYAILNWTALENGTSKVYNVPLNNSVKDVFSSPTIYSYLHQNEPENILIAMPDKITAVVGDTLQLYYKGMFRCVNPYIYAITLQCDIGSQYPRYYEVTPTISNVGEHTLTVQLRDNNGNIINAKNITIAVVAAPTSPAVQKNIFCVGASLTQNGEWVGEFKRKLIEDYNLSNINFIGRMAVNGAHLEATGGYSWTSYTSTTSALLYKFYFNNDHLPTVINVGDVYTVNAYNYTITEINIPTPDGGGYISCVGDGSPGAASGTLTRVNGEGDATLTYYNYVTNGNPFLYNGQINLPQYMTDYCGGVSPDVVYTELFVNGSGPYNANVATRMELMKSFVQMFHSVYPDCKIVLGMPACPDEKGGIGENYHAAGNFSWGYGIKWTFMQYMAEIEDFLVSNDLSSYVSLVNWTNEFDSENDYMQTTKAVNVRSTQTEVFGVNGVHPANAGYMQMADSAVRHFVAHFCQ